MMTIETIECRIKELEAEITSLKAELKRLRAGSPPTEEEFERELVDAGILDEHRPPSAAIKPLPDWKPVEIKGRPLSETIIEERR